MAAKERDPFVILTDSPLAIRITRIGCFFVGTVFIIIGREIFVESNFEPWSVPWLLSIAPFVIGPLLVLTGFTLPRAMVTVDRHDRVIRVLRYRLGRPREERYAFGDIRQAELVSGSDDAFVRLRLRSGQSVLVSNLGKPTEEAKEAVAALNALIAQRAPDAIHS